MALDYALRYHRLETEIEQSATQVEEQTKQLRAERDRADFLYRVTQEMTRTLDLERVLNRTLARVSQALGVRQGSILLLDPESGYLVYRVALGRPEALPLGGTLTQAAAGAGLGAEDAAEALERLLAAGGAVKLEGGTLVAAENLARLTEKAPAVTTPAP